MGPRACRMVHLNSECVCMLIPSTGSIGAFGARPLDTQDKEETIKRLIEHCARDVAITATVELLHTSFALDCSGLTILRSFECLIDSAKHLATISDVLCIPLCFWAQLAPHKAARVAETCRLPAVGSVIAHV